MAKLDTETRISVGATVFLLVALLDSKISVHEGALFMLAYAAFIGLLFGFL